MTRKIVLAAVKQAVTSTGYTFLSGFEYRMDADTEAFPTVWLTTPKILKNQGREEGVRHYLLNLTLLQLCGENTAQGKEEQWCAMESDLMRMCGLLRENPAVRHITLKECSPAEFSVTAKGELSISANIVAEINFRNHNPEKT